MPDEPPPPPPQELPEPGLPVAKIDWLYRVFCASADMPPLEKLLARLTSGNPYNPPGSFIFSPGAGLRRLQDALGASKDFFVMGYLREEAPELFEDVARAIAANEAQGFEEHDRAIAAEARLCVVLRAEITNPPNNEFVETLVHLADAFRDLLDGVVWDVHMGKVFGHGEWRERVMEEPFSVLNHVSIASDGGALRTRGLKKFGSPELEVAAVPADVATEVANMLRDFAEHIVQGELVEPDEVIEYTHGRVRLAPSRAGVLEIVDDEGPGPGMPKVFEALRATRRGGSDAGP